MMNCEYAQQRYLHDAEFHALVDYIEQMAERLQYTPGEVRDAAMFAMLRLEMRRYVRSIEMERPLREQ